MPKNKTVITIDLGTGERGELRKQALEAQAALAGHTWNGKPSIGRWMTAMADEWLEKIYQSIQQQKGK